MLDERIEDVGRLLLHGTLLFLRRGGRGLRLRGTRGRDRRRGGGRRRIHPGVLGPVVGPAVQLPARLSDQPMRRRNGVVLLVLPPRATVPAGLSAIVQIDDLPGGRKIVVVRRRHFSPSFPVQLGGVLVVRIDDVHGSPEGSTKPSAHRWRSRARRVARTMRAARRSRSRAVSTRFPTGRPAPRQLQGCAADGGATSPTLSPRRRRARRRRAHPRRAHVAFIRVAFVRTARASSSITALRSSSTA